MAELTRAPAERLRLTRPGLLQVLKRARNVNHAISMIEAWQEWEMLGGEEFNRATIKAALEKANGNFHIVVTTLDLESVRSWRKSDGSNP